MITIFKDFGTAEKLEAKMLESAESLGTTALVFAKIQEDIFRIEEKVFSSGGRRGGGSWKRLADDTIKRKGGSNPLRDTDALFDSVTKPGAEFQILEITAEGMLFGTDRPWAMVQQEGTADGHIPARPFLRFMPSDVNRWTVMILEHIVRPFVV